MAWWSGMEERGYAGKGLPRNRIKEWACCYSMPLLCVLAVYVVAIDVCGG